MMRITVGSRDVDLTEEDIELVEAILNNPIGSYEVWGKSFGRARATAKKRANELTYRLGLPVSGAPQKDLVRWCLEHEGTFRDPIEESFDQLPQERHVRPSDSSSARGGGQQADLSLRNLEGREFLGYLRSLSNRGYLHLHVRPDQIRTLWERVYRRDANSAGATILLKFGLSATEDVDVFAEVMAYGDLSICPLFALTGPYAGSTEVFSPKVHKAVSDRINSLLDPREAQGSQQPASPPTGLDPVYVAWLLASATESKAGGSVTPRPELVRLWRWARSSDADETRTWPLFIGELTGQLAAVPIESRSHYFPDTAWEGLVNDLLALDTVRKAKSSSVDYILDLSGIAPSAPNLDDLITRVLRTVLRSAGQARFRSGFARWMSVFQTLPLHSDDARSDVGVSLLSKGIEFYRGVGAFDLTPEIVASLRKLYTNLKAEVPSAFEPNNQRTRLNIESILQSWEAQDRFS